MTVERDMAGFAVPFTAGVAAAVLYVYPYGTASCIYVSSSFFLTILCASLLVLDIKEISPFTRILIFAAALACGLVTGATGIMTSVSTVTGSGPLTSAAAIFAERIKEIIDTIPFEREETGNLVKALITGDRTGISYETSAVFRKSGASHILALSGMHLGIIYAIARKSAGWLGNSPAAEIIKSSATIAICSFYTLATGAGPSTVRALIFIIIGETARTCRRTTDLRNTLFAAIVIHLAIAPESVREIGFQLSYAAMAGIAFIFPKLSKIWPEDAGVNPLRWIWNSAALSISCQLTAGTLAYFYFGTFPRHFMLTNLMAVPLIGIIIPLSVLTTAAHAAGICPDILARLTEYTVSLMAESLKIIAGM